LFRFSSFLLISSRTLLSTIVGVDSKRPVVADETVVELSSLTPTLIVLVIGGALAVVLEIVHVDTDVCEVKTVVV
jgi:hypothetical protein